MEQQKEKIMRIVIFTVLIVFISRSSFSQNEKYIRPELISASATLSPALMLTEPDVNYYISGFGEYRFHRFFSIRGDIYGLLGNANTKFLRNNIRTYIGIQYGYPFGNLEPHVGIGTGLSVLQSNYAPNNTEVSPSVSINVGVRFYVWKYFHFFGKIDYIHQRLNNLPNRSGMADEIVFSAGLGFNLNVIKEK